MITASTGASLRLGARRAELPWQNMTSSPMPAPTLSTAMIVFIPGRNLVGSLSSTSCGRTKRSFRPPMDGSFLVATTEPSTRARNMLFGDRFLRQHCVHVAVRPGGHMNADQLALDCLDGLRAGIGRSFDCGDVADNDRSDEGIANLGHGAGQLDVGRFEHRVGALDEGDQTAGFDKSNCLMRHVFI